MATYKKRDYNIAIKRVTNLREITKINKKDFAYHKYAKQVIFLTENIDFHFTDNMGLELAEDIAVDISFRDAAYRQHRITDATLARYVRSGYHWALFNDGFSEETIN